jgi:hypothetical protein
MATINEMRTSPVSASTAAAKQATNYTTNIRGVHVNTDGTMVCVFVDDADATVRTLQVKGGMYYPYVLKRIDATSTATFGCGLI